MDEEEEAFEELRDAIIDLRLIVGAYYHFTIPLPEWWMKIEWMSYPNQIGIMEKFMDDWPGFWTAYFNDPACDENVAAKTIRLRNDLYKKIAKAKNPWQSEKQN